MVFVTRVVTLVEATSAGTPYQATLVATLVLATMVQAPSKKAGNNSYHVCTFFTMVATVEIPLVNPWY